jgi:hypothetical protein
MENVDQAKSKKRLSFTINYLTCLFITFTQFLISQTSIFSENIGSPSGTTTIASNSFQTALTFSGTGDIRNTTTSSGYTGSSAGGNVFLTNSASKTFEISGISTTSYTSLILNFGALKSSTTSTMSELTLEYSTNGSSYTTLTIPAQATGTGTASWRLISINLPVGTEAASNLRLRWTNTGTSPQFRLDDISLTGSTVSCTTPTIQASSFSSNSITNTTMNISFTRGNGDGGVLIVAKSGSAVNADPTNGTTYTANSTFGSGTQIGTGNYVIYKGVSNGTSTATGNISISGLTGSTTYHFAIYEYNATSTCFNQTELTGNQTTSGSNASDYFRSLATGNWNTAGTWQSSSNNSTWLTSTLVPTSSATSITIQSGHTITINSNATSSTLNINGTLSFDGTDGRTLTSTGDITISSTGTFNSPNSGGYAYLSTNGNITNNNILDFYTTGSCDVTFNKNGNQTISGTGSTTHFNVITVDMGTSNSNILEITSTNFATNTEFMHYSSTTANELKNGTIKFSGTFTYSNEIFYTGKSHEILSTCGFWVNNPNMTVTASGDSWDISGIFRLSQGTINIGTNAGNSLRTKGTTAQIIIEGGTLTIAGRISPTTAGSNSFTYNQSGGTVTLNTVGSTSSTLAAFDMSSNLSNFTISGGTIIIRNKTSNTKDYYNPASTFSVTGGTIQFGDASSSNAQIFTLISTADLPNLTISNATSQATKPSLLLGSNITVKGNITIMSNTTLDVSNNTGTNSYNISNTGNWINNGSFTQRASTVTFSGSSAQSISGNSTTSFYGLTMNNSSSTGVTLASPAIITNSLILTDGIIYASNPNYLTLNAGSTSTSGSAASFVDGPMKKVGSTDFVFPVGNGSNWRRIKISSLSSSETFTAQYVNSAYSNTTTFKTETSPLLWVSDIEYWSLTRVGSIDAVVELYWENANESELPNCMNLRIAHWDNVNSYWEKANIDAISTTGSCSGVASGTIYTTADVIEFSPFTYGSISISALPITLTTFEAELNNRQVELNWEVESEKNNDFYTIEKTIDGKQFEIVEKIPSKSKSNIISNYFVVDSNPYFGLSYYRLSQTDFNGNTTVFPMQSITINNSIEQSENIYPNPIEKNTNLTCPINGQNGDLIKITISDPLGKIQFNQLFQLSYKNEPISLSISDEITTGIYYVTILNGQLSKTEKLIIK